VTTYNKLKISKYYKMSSDTHHHESTTLAGIIRKETGVPAVKCYQCGKCSAGCPLATEMDYPPSVIMRMLQCEIPALEEKVLESYTIWLCLTCEMCYGRCPMEIDIPRIMDYCREKSLREGKVNPKAKNILQFHKAFLDMIEHTGRLYELGLTMDYKVRSMKLMQDVPLAPKMLSRGKLHILPEGIKGKKNMKNIFDKTLKNKEDGK